MTTAPQQATSHTSRVAGYLLALSAGATWGTTGPLSTGLYRLMPATSIGFWRVLIGTVCLALWGLAFRRELFRGDGRGWPLVGVGGGSSQPRPSTRDNSRRERKSTRLNSSHASLPYAGSGLTNRPSA